MPRFVKAKSCMSDPDPVVHEALRWLRFAEEDLAVALQLLTGTRLLRVTLAGFPNKQQKRP